VSAIVDKSILHVKLYDDGYRVEVRYAKNNIYRYACEIDHPDGFSVMDLFHNTDAALNWADIKMEQMRNGLIAL